MPAGVKSREDGFVPSSVTTRQKSLIHSLGKIGFDHLVYARLGVEELVVVGRERRGGAQALGCPEQIRGSSLQTGTIAIHRRRDGRFENSRALRAPEEG